MIDQNFVDRLRIVELLEDVTKWKKPLGFYLTRGLGHQFWRRDNIQIAPVVKTGGDEIMGITLDIQGTPAVRLYGRSYIAAVTGSQRRCARIFCR